MDEDPKVGKPVIRWGDRILLFVLCLVFFFGFGSAYYAINEWQPADTFEHILKFSGRELTMTLLLFALLVMIRCFVSTTRLESALASITFKVLIAVMLVACAITALLVLAFSATF
jgi:amino acid permease